VAGAAGDPAAGKAAKDAVNQAKQGRLIVISGPSGVGKSTIVREARSRTEAAFSVSATTRPPRPGEVDGTDYLFVDRPAFEKMIAAGELLEWAEVFGQLYGTPAEPVRRALDDGRTVLLDIDVQGGIQVHRAMPSATFVLIVPPGDEELARRLRGRGTEDPQAAAARLAQAKREMDAAEASGAYEYKVVNDELGAAIDEVVAILTQENASR